LHVRPPIHFSQTKSLSFNIQSASRFGHGRGSFLQIFKGQNEKLSGYDVAVLGGFIRLPPGQEAAQYHIHPYR
jgi:hypothetical protein